MGSKGYTLTNTCHRGAKRNGFSLLEVTVGMLMASIVVILASNVAVDISRGFVDSIATTRLTTEFRLFGETLRRDFTGSLPEDRVGSPNLWRLVGRRINSPTELQLCYDAQEDGSVDWAADDRIITYLLDDDVLVRQDSISGTEFVVARGVTDLEFSLAPGVIEIFIELRRGNVAESFQFVTADLP